MDMHARGMLPYDRIKLAILDEVDLTGAQLDGADLTGTNLDGSVNPVG